MKFTIARNTLLNELAWLQGAADRKMGIPILGYVLLQAKNDRLTLHVTDLEITLTTRCEADATVSGSICLPVRRLWELVKSLPPETVECQADAEGHTEINCLATRFKLTGLPMDQFPELPTFTGVMTEAPADLLADDLPRLMHAVSAEETRYALKGARLEINDERMRFIVTDGSRLALLERTGCPVSNLSVTALVPKKAISELSKLAATSMGEDKPLALGVTTEHFACQSGERRLVSRLLTGDFPNYEKVIPQDNPRTFTMDRGLIAAAVRRVGLMADERAHTLKLVIGNGEIQLLAHDLASGGEAEETLFTHDQGAEFSIGFNAQYLSDFFNAVQEEAVTCAFKDERTQALFTVTLDERTQWQEIIMPMKLS
jgi:DNA polymerase III subunit beta